MRTLKKLPARLTLLIGGLCIGILLCEGIARFPSFPSDSDLLFNSPDSSPVGLYVLDKKVRIVPAPNFTAQAQSLGFSAALRTNRIGIRGPQPESIPTDTKQWLAVGDSFTMSVQVSEEDSFQGRLGKKRNVHIWNGGVDGYSTWQASLRYTQLNSELPIEHVILTFFTGNDFQDNAHFPMQQRQPLPGKAGSPIPRTILPFWKLFLLKHSYLYAHYRIYEQRNKLKKQVHQARNWKQELSIFNAVGVQQLQKLTNNTEKALIELKRITTKNNTKLTVAIAPPAFVVDQSRMSDTFLLVGLDPAQARLDTPQKTILSLLKKLNINACDLTPALRDGTADRYFKTDGHWTPYGHKIVAQALEQCISKTTD
jgi:lysophospholipase L1-like esterase